MASVIELGGVIDNPDQSRFEIQIDGFSAVAEYQIVGRSMIFTHTEVPPALRGQGIASRLAETALQAARERELEVVPLCPFITEYVRDHPEFHGLLSEANRRRLGLEEGS